MIHVMRIEWNNQKCMLSSLEMGRSRDRLRRLLQCLNIQKTNSMGIIVVYGVVGGMKCWVGVMHVVIVIRNTVHVWVRRVRRMH